MNFGIYCAGKRVELVRQFIEEFEPEIGVYVFDKDINSPALYVTDKRNDYRAKIDHGINLNDYSIAMNRGTSVKPSDLALTACIDKNMTGGFFGVKTPPKVVVKPRYGSGSEGVTITQLYLEGQEYNIQAYYDIHTSELITAFHQKKLQMRNGETYKSESIWEGELEKIALQLSDKDLKGAIDIDVMECDNEYYVLDINTRFGGGYPLAHECGVNFIKLLKRNILKGELKPKQAQYKLGVTMMKYPATMYRGVE